MSKRSTQADQGAGRVEGKRTEVFISATSGDLRTMREIVKQGLLTMGCFPIEQTNFEPDYRTVLQIAARRTFIRSVLIGNCSMMDALEVNRRPMWAFEPTASSSACGRSTTTCWFFPVGTSCEFSPLGGSDSKSRSADVSC